MNEVTTTPTPIASAPSSTNVETCALHVIVPVQAKRRAKIAAELSGLRFKEFLAQLLMNASPLSTNTGHDNKEPS